MLDATVLDREHRKRVDELATEHIESDSELELSEVFSSRTIKSSIPSDKVFLDCYDEHDILLNFPFVENIYVGICTACSCVHNDSLIEFLLHNGIITPVLTCPYEDYPEKFLKLILPYPHISFYEFSFYRNFMLREQSKAILCSHCVEEFKENLIDLGSNMVDRDQSEQNIGILTSNIYPFIDDDFKFLDEMKKALNENSIQKAGLISSFSYQLRALRTSQAFTARQIYDREYFTHGLSQLPISNNSETKKDVRLIEDSFSKSLDIPIPEKDDLENYIVKVEPYRSELSFIIKSLIEESSDDSSLVYSTLVSKVGDLNEDIKTLQKSKKFLAYKASTSIIKNNKTLISAGIVAGILGMAGSYVPCTASVIGGALAKVAGKKMKFNTKMPAEVIELNKAVDSSLRPLISRLISKCLKVDERAVHIWEIKKSLQR